MPYYNYTQNNSGGGFTYDAKKGITHYVLIEAATPAQANARAKELGIYFNGCDTGDDCSCCGDRWYEASKYDESAKPEVYGKSPSVYAKQRNSLKWMKGYEIFVHPLKGKFKGYWNGKSK